MSYAQPDCRKCYQPFTSRGEAWTYYINAARRMITPSGILRGVAEFMTDGNNSECIWCKRDIRLFKQKWYRKKVKAAHQRGDIDDETYQEFKDRISTNPDTLY